MAYCDELQDEIKTHLNKNTRFHVTKVNWDLHPKEGYLLSTKKVIELEDSDYGNKKYKITVEEV